MGNRLEGLINLSGWHESYRFSPDYRFVELQMHPMELDDNKFKRNQTHVLHVGSINPSDNRVRMLVTVNPKLLAYANAPATFILEGIDGKQDVNVVAQFRKDMKPDELPWLVRMYMVRHD